MTSESYEILINTYQIQHVTKNTDVTSTKTQKPETVTTVGDKHL